MDAAKAGLTSPSGCLVASGALLKCTAALLSAAQAVGSSDKWQKDQAAPYTGSWEQIAWNMQGMGHCSGENKQKTFLAVGNNTGFWDLEELVATSSLYSDHFEIQAGVCVF